MRRRLLAAALLIPAALAGVAPAVADLAQPAVVSTNPVDFTPHVLDGTVWAIAVVGDTVVVGGNFTRSPTAPDADRYARQQHLRVRAATTARSGRSRPPSTARSTRWPPGPSNTVYVGGSFKTVNGVAAARPGPARPGQRQPDRHVPARRSTGVTSGR